MGIDSHRRFLPHFYPANVPIFVTFRTKDSLSKTLVKEITNKYLAEMTELEKVEIPNRDEKLAELKKKYFYIIDKYCDSINCSDVDLTSPPNLNIIRESVLFNPSEIVNVLCFTIMRNHIHLLLVFPESNNSLNGKKIRLPDYIHNVKGYTGKMINKNEKRTGSLWMREYYDVLIRSRKQLCRTVSYILQNPVKAGMFRSYEQAVNNYWNDELIFSLSGYTVKDIMEIYGRR